MSPAARVSSSARRAVLVAALLLVAVIASAQQTQTGRYLQTQTVTNAATTTACTAGSTPTGCLADVATTAAFVTVETNPIRWTVSGTAPTTTTGHLAQAGATITIQGHLNVVNFQMIATGANATVTSTVFRP